MATCSISLAGKYHPENQDRYFLDERDGYVVAAVADGVGSTPRAGSVAGYFVDQCAGLLTRLAMLKPHSLEPYLQAYFKDVYGRFCSEFASDKKMMESGAAVVVVIMGGGRLHCLWSGDSQAFCCRRSASGFRVSRITRPDFDDAAKTLTDWFGAYAYFDMHYADTSTEPGDVVVVCSDGAELDEPYLEGLLDPDKINQRGVVELAQRGLVSDSGDDVTILMASV